MADPIALRAPKASAPFAPGAVVALNSGGLTMTVRECDKGVVTVDWQNNNGDPYTTDYLAAMLFEPEDEPAEDAALRSKSV